jgi:ferric iron reductase protein FhuF
VSGGAAAVLAEVRSRVGYLRASIGEPPRDESGWHDCETLTATDLDAAVHEGLRPSGDTHGDAGAAPQRSVVASLLIQSYAHRVTAVSLAAYAIGLCWPSPRASNTSVRLADGRAKGLRFRSAELGAPDDAAALVAAALDAHLVPVAAELRASQPLGQRLVWANVAASFAAAFRAVDAAARDRRDAVEQAGVRRRAERLVASAPLLSSAGWFEPDSDEWGWQRAACCLWYRTSGGRTCEGCSLRRRARL